jgi:hypothetical protein
VERELKVRPIIAEDRDGGAELIRLGYESVPAATHAPFSPHRASALIDTLIDGRIDSVRGFVLVRGPIRLGFALVQIAPQLFCDDLMAGVSVFYVMPEARNLSAVSLLAEACEGWASARGCKALHLTLDCGYRPELVERLFRGLRFSFNGAHLVKEIP